MKTKISDLLICFRIIWAMNHTNKETVAAVPYFTGFERVICWLPKFHEVFIIYIIFTHCKVYFRRMRTSSSSWERKMRWTPNYTLKEKLRFRCMMVSHMLSYQLRRVVMDLGNFTGNFQTILWKSITGKRSETLRKWRYSYILSLRIEYKLYLDGEK